MVLVRYNPAYVEVFIGNRRFAAGHFFDDWLTRNRRWNFLRFTRRITSFLGEQERLSMAPHLAPMFHHTKAGTAEQDQDGQPAANQPRMEMNFHWTQVYCCKLTRFLRSDSYRIRRGIYKIYRSRPEREEMGKDRLTYLLASSYSISLN